MGRTRGNDAPWKARKTKKRFPALPPALGNRWCVSHIPTGSTTNLPPSDPPNGTLARKVLLNGVGLGYNYGSPATAPMAGFEVTIHGRFWGDRRGSNCFGLASMDLLQ